MITAHHPAFGGKFGLKAVLPALTGESYNDLAVGNAGVASSALVRLLFNPPPDEEHERLRTTSSHTVSATRGGGRLRRLRELAA